MRDGFAGVRSEMTGIRSEIDALRQTTIRVGGGMLLGFISVLAAIIAGGG